MRKPQIKPWIVTALTLLVIAGIAWATTSPPGRHAGGVQMVCQSTWAGDVHGAGIYCKTGTGLVQHSIDNSETTVGGGGGSVTSVVIGNGLASSQSPLTTTGTMSINTSITVDKTTAQTLSSKTLTAPIVNGCTSSGSTAIDFSGNTGAFKTPTGACTFGGSSNSLTAPLTGAGSSGLVKIQSGSTSGFFQSDDSIGNYQGYGSNTQLTDGTNQTFTGGSTSSQMIHSGIGDRYSTATKTGDYTITLSDHVLFADTSGGAINLTLPAPSAGAEYVVVDSSGTGTFTTHNCVLLRHGSEKIDGASSSKTLATSGTRTIVTTNGTDWFTK